jgi:hypothetical protein
MGCTIPVACNYDPVADCDDGSCILPDGCTDVAACNFDPGALCDDGSCLVCEIGTIAEELFLSCDTPVDYTQPIETSWIPGCANWDFDYTEPIYTCPNSYSFTHSYIIVDDCGDYIEVTQIVYVEDNEPPTITQFPPENITVASIEDIPDCSSIEVLGIDNCSEEVIIWEDSFLILDECTYIQACDWTLFDQCGNWSYTTWFVTVDPSNFQGCTDSDACNYVPDVVCDDGSCLYLDECGNCGGTDTTGCTDPAACNYDAEADCDDGSCLANDECGNCGGTGTAGCTDSLACNYDATADCDDGSCELPDGCTDPTACNYDVDAVCDDGSCIFPDGCTDPAACNYDAAADCGDGSCLVNDECGNCG